MSHTRITESGTEGWLPEFGLMRAFRSSPRTGDTAHEATNDLGAVESVRRMSAELSWGLRSATEG